MSKQAQRFERKTRRLEKKYIGKIQEAILKQLLDYSKGINSNLLDAVYSIDKYFDDKRLSDVYVDMMEETAQAFKIEDEKEIFKGIDGATWVSLLTQFITNEGGQRITQINRFTKAYVLSKLRPILNNGIEEGLGIREIGKNIVANISEYSGKFARYRAERIARTEIISTANWSSLTSAKGAGLGNRLQKKWLVSLDGRERANHAEMANKPPIPLDGDFEVPNTSGGVDLMQYPGDRRGSAGNVINCRCTVIYVRANE
jgi:hypothetical protein